MANTFFGFDTSLNHGDHRLSPDEDCLETEEEEYDALNDETFGALEDASNVEDWEQQHEQLAEIAESSRRSEHLENSLSQLVDEDSDESPLSLQDDSLWSFKSASKNGDIFNSTLVSDSRKSTSKSFNEPRPQVKSAVNAKLFNNTMPGISTTSNLVKNIPKKICTVEELERGLLNSRIQKPTANIPPPHIPHPMFQQPPHPPRLPPGLHLRHLQPMPPSNLPPGLVRMMTSYPPVMPNGPPHPAHHRMMYPPGNAQFPVAHPFNFPPPPRNANVQNAGGQTNRIYHPQQQKNRNEANHFRAKQPEVCAAVNVEVASKDDYAGLMTNREKQWLLNIQMLQLNTGTPYFDDYYYTVFKERKSKSNKENQQVLDRNQRYAQNGHQRNQRDHYRNNDRQDAPNPLQGRVYTPLQFENSLGKLQCGSVTAPRKIIDMDVVTLEKDVENVTTSRDTRKTKQLLLELEMMYSLILKAEDLRNPVALSNIEKLRELKQKQRLRELEAAPTAEQKQEVLKLLQQESVPVVEKPHDYLVKVVSGLLQEEKYTSFFNIRKGKMLLVRVLPHLTTEAFGSQLLDLWLKLLLSVPIIGRRDTAGDNLLPRLHPYFKRYIQTCKMADILVIVSNITETVRVENSRSTPLSHQGKSPLHFIITNKLGVSSLVTTFVRCEYLISSENTSEKQRNDWYNFVTTWADAVFATPTVATPIELIPRQIFIKHCNRIESLTSDRRSLLEGKLVDTN